MIGKGRFSIMAMWKNMKLRQKFISTLVVMATLVVVLLGIAYASFMKMGSLMNGFGSTGFVCLKDELSLRKDIQTINKRLLLTIYESDTTKPDDTKADFDERFAKMDSQITELGNLMGNKSLTDPLASAMETLKTDAYAIIDQVSAGDLDAAKTAYDDGFNAKTSENFVSALGAVGDQVEKEADDTIALGQEITTRMSVILVVLAVVVIVFCIIIFMRLASGITQGVTAVQKIVGKLEEGDFDVQVDTSKYGKDEIGDMVRDVKKMSEQTQQVIADICYVLGNMANGNFAVKSQVEDAYVGDYKEIIEAYGKINSSLADIFINMNQVAGQVQSGSQQIADGSMALSQGATEQASTLEEISATIQNLSQKVKENAASAKEVEQFSANVATKIADENEKMSQVSDAMKEIENKSNQIENIIKAIDDIAFQTNILALNAAVEAARAGAAGKGFAVVADEVRNLAGKSADAAKETSDLIESAIQAIQHGSKMVIDSAKSLNEVKENSDQSKLKVAEIADAMQREAKSIAELTTGLEQISQVVQQNSATAEESSASSQELSDHAATLKGMVDKITC